MEEYVEYPLQRLISSDRFYDQVRERLEDPNEKDSKGYSLLHIATQSHEDNSRVVQLLLDKGAVVDSTTPDGHTPLHFAVSSRKRDAVVALIEARASVNSKDLLGRTALHFSVSKGLSYSPSPVLNIVCDMWIVERLLCHPEITLDPADEKGDTPLMWAVKERYSNAVEKLLKKGANPNIPNQTQRTPLHEALSSRNPSDDIVSFLLTNGAGIYCEDNLQQTPVDILVRNSRNLKFTVEWIKIIVLRYHITESFERHFKTNPMLSDSLNFNRCCEEVRLMKRLIIYDNVTLHDFALDCFQWTAEDPAGDICVTIVVELLLTRICIEYFDTILHRIPYFSLYRMLARLAVGTLFYRHPIPPDTSHLTLYFQIACFYYENEKRRNYLNEIIGVIGTLHKRMLENDDSFFKKP